MISNYLNNRKAEILQSIEQRITANRSVNDLISQLAMYNQATETGGTGGGGDTGASIDIDLEAITDFQQEGLNLLGGSVSSPIAGSALDRLEQIKNGIDNISIEAPTPDYYSDDFDSIISVLGEPPVGAGAAIIDKIDSLESILSSSQLTNSQLSNVIARIEENGDRLDSIIHETVPTAAYNFNHKELTGPTPTTLENVYGLKFQVITGSVVLTDSQSRSVAYPKIGDYGEIFGFAYSDQAKVTGYTFDTTNGTCLVQYLTKQS